MDCANGTSTNDEGDTYPICNIIGNECVGNSSYMDCQTVCTGHNSKIAERCPLYSQELPFGEEFASVLKREKLRVEKSTLETRLKEVNGQLS